MNNQTRTDRTRKFFQLDSWDMDAADAWQHVLNGVCDDEDLHGNLDLSALDLSDMFNEYRAFGSACNDAFHYLIDNVDAIVRIAGFVYIDCAGTGAGKVEFVDTDVNHRDRAAWLLQCAQNGAGVLLRAVVDSVGAINVELVC